MGQGRDRHPAKEGLAFLIQLVNNCFQADPLLSLCVIRSIQP
jgi:hypothetical protein